MFVERLVGWLSRFGLVRETEFTVAGEPKPCPRPRASRIGGKALRIYLPEGNGFRGYQAAAASQAKAAGLQEPLAGPVWLEIEFVFSPLKTVDREIHERKPDVDNLLKAIMDGLTDVVWCDDRQVIGAAVIKRVANYAEEPHTRVSVHTK